MVFSSVTLPNSLEPYWRRDGKRPDGITSYPWSEGNQPYNRKDLTYTITDYTRKISRSKVDSIIAQAFAAWAHVTDLGFTRKNSAPADIIIRFVTGDHSDGHPFDGPWNVLAHAAYGFAHFDDSENWSTSLDSGSINLYAVAVHEFGHVLGLGHSDIEEAMMYASYGSDGVVIHLHSDDIDGIQKLYGAKTTGPSNGGGSNTADGPLSDCWTTGCQLNSWAVVGCAQYQRKEKNKSRCPGGHVYECCIGNGKNEGSRRQPTSRSNSGSGSECWTTGCQLNTWAVVGCQQYGMSQVQVSSCPGGHMYNCCK